MVGEPWMDTRYSRHRSLPDFGEMGQKALVESTVICIDVRTTISYLPRRTVGYGGTVGAVGYAARRNGR